jgi:hypothetical protein
LSALIIDGPLRSLQAPESLTGHRVQLSRGFTFHYLSESASGMFEIIADIGVVCLLYCLLLWTNQRSMYYRSKFERLSVAMFMLKRLPRMI